MTEAARLPFGVSVGCQVAFPCLGFSDCPLLEAWWVSQPLDLQIFSWVLVSLRPGSPCEVGAEPAGVSLVRLLCPGVRSEPGWAVTRGGHSIPTVRPILRGLEIPNNPY